jgi:hypothetical protein
MLSDCEPFRKALSAVAAYHAVHHNSVTPLTGRQNAAWRRTLYMMKYDERNG